MTRIALVVAMILLGGLASVTADARRHDANAAPASCARSATSAADMNAAVVTGIAASDSFRTDGLPDGRWMSVTGDTVLPGEPYPRWDNSVVIWDRTGQRRVGTGNFFPRWPDGSEFWPGQWTAAGDIIYVVGSRQLVRGLYDWTTLGAYVATIHVPSCGTPRFGAYITTPSSGLGDDVVQWSGALTRADGWYYIHGLLDRPDQFHARDGAYVARTANPVLPWAFWTGTGWSVDPAAAVPTIPVAGVGGTEAAYTLHRLSVGWTIATKRGGSLASDIGTYTSPSPTGPWIWTPRVTVCAVGCYLAGAAPVPTRSGRFMIQWSRTDAMPVWTEITL
jgi:hypothetical protein